VEWQAFVITVQNIASGLVIKQTFIILSRALVTIDGVWIDEYIY
jgi:hypothetical protein